MLTVPRPPTPSPCRAGRSARSVVLAALVFLVTACAHTGKPSERQIRMLADQDPPVSRADRAMAADRQPRPLPAEPFPGADPEAEVPAAMLLDLEYSAAADEGAALERGKDVPPAEEPEPLPEEPEPPR